MRKAADFAAPAEALAIEALGFVASDPERLARFLDLTGLSPVTIREAAASPGFLVAVLDHLAGDESLLVAFAGNADVPPARILAARDALAGPDAMGLREA